jgi:predicted SnoaL-like aldol condensation-catalyzing enzyme
MMRKFAAVLPAIALVACTSAASVAPAEADATTATNREVVTAFARQFYDERDVRGAFEQYVAADYIQHNPGIADGRDAAIAALEPMFSQPDASFSVKRIIVDGKFAVIHLHGRGDPATPGAAVADIYRLEDGMIVEHWDVLQPITSSTANPHPFF